MVVVGRPSERTVGRDMSRAVLDDMRLVPESPDQDGLPVLHVAPGHLIRCAQQVHWNLWVQHVSTDLTSVQYAILLVVGEHPNIGQRTVGAYVSLDKSTTADVLARLARRGLVVRERDARDGRRVLVRLTEPGRAALLTMAPSVVDVQERLMAPLSVAQGRSLLHVLRLVAYRGRPPSLTPNPAIDGWPERLPAVRLHSAPGHLIRRSQQVHTTLWGELVGTALTSAQYNVLLVLHHQPGIDQRTLGERASLDKSTGADVIARIEARGLISRKRDLADGRRNVLMLSESGHCQLFHHAAGVVEVQQDLLRPLSRPQRQTFLSLMTQVCEHLL